MSESCLEYIIETWGSSDQEQDSIGEILTLVETTSKTTLDLSGDFHLLFIWRERN